MPNRPHRSTAREIAVLRRTLRNLDRSLRRLGRMLAIGPTRRASSQGQKVRRRPRLSAKARSALKLQGRYMGFMRQLKAKQKVRVREIRESQDVRAAIIFARRLLGKGVRASQ